MQPLNQTNDSTSENYFPSVTTTITVEDSINQKGDVNRVFVETFLIDAVSKPNKKGWKVSYDNPSDFDRRVLDSKNHPLVLYQAPHPSKRGELIWDHPVAPITTLEAAADPVRANIEFQKKYTIGYARHFKKIKDGLWHATYEIVNERAKKFFKKAKDKGLQLFTSPYIVRPSAEKDRTNIKNWALIHNAIVSQPANSEEIATIKEVCTASKNDPYSCSSLFASLSAVDDDDTTTNTDAANKEEDCGFCVEQSLTDYQTWISSQFTKIPTLINMTESGSASSFNNSSPSTPSSAANAPVPQPQQQVTVPAAAFNPSIGNSAAQQQLLSQQQQQQQESNQQQEPNNPNPQKDTEPQPQQDNNKDEKDARIADLERKLQDLNKRYVTDQRKNQVERLFSPIEILYADPATGVLNEKIYLSEINKYVHSNHSLDEIKEIVESRYIKAQAQSQQQSSNNNNRRHINNGEKASMTPDNYYSSSHVSETASFPYTQMSASPASSQTAAANNRCGEIPTWLSVLRKSSEVLSAAEGGKF